MSAGREPDPPTIFVTSRPAPRTETKPLSVQFQFSAQTPGPMSISRGSAAVGTRVPHVHDSAAVMVSKQLSGVVPVLEQSFRTRMIFSFASGKAKPLEA